MSSEDMTNPPDGADADRWARIEQLCDAALKLRPPERAAFLSNECRGDTHLRDEVLALLAHEDAAEGLLESPIGAVAAELVGRPMPDLVGRRFGDYHIVAKIGEGGMGEVYRARDRKLGRDVAIKVLPSSFADDRERLKRFDREARLLASVNHAGIGAIYGLIDVQRVPALVLELVEGETLAAVLARGPLALARALSIAALIADALDHAHGHGIIHRDLKPSNIMLTRSGVKLLDFGVGKWTPAAGDGTMTRPSTLTGEGAIIGTLHYMSPEQLEGRPVDGRSDIFAFGTVLFEMVSGRKAFDARSQAGIIAAVIEGPRPRLPGIVGRHDRRLDRIVNKCLATSADDRWQSAGDLADELRWLGDELTSSDDTVGLTSTPPAGRSRWLNGAAAVAIAAVGLVGWAVRPGSSPAVSTLPVVRFEIDPPPGTAYDFGGFDISPDGTQLAYVGYRVTEGRRIYVRRLDRGDSYLIPDTNGAVIPRFSPDGQWIAFSSRGTVKKVRSSGDLPPQIVSEGIGGIHGLSWGGADTIMIASAGLGLRRVSSDGGVATEFSKIPSDEVIDDHTPTLLPDLKHLLVGVHGKANRFSIGSQTIDGQTRTTILDSGFAPFFLPRGHLVFSRNNSILAAPFDADARQLTGPPVTMVERVDTVPAGGLARFALSSSGVLVYIAQQPTSQRTLTWVDQHGKISPLLLPPGAFDTPRISPDGTQLAFSLEQEDGQRQIWTYEFASNKRTQLTSDGDYWSPLWTRDGEALIFGKATAAGSELIMRSLTTGTSRTLASSANRLIPGTLTAGGEALIINEAPPTDEYVLSQLVLGKDATPAPLPIGPSVPRGASISPDGRWLAYAARQSGPTTQVFVQSYPSGAEARQISVEGGREPMWSRDGRNLFYRSDRGMFAVSVDLSHALRWTAPRLVFEGDYVSTFLDYDVTSDGRFVMIVPDPQERVPVHFNVVFNWASEVAARVPVRR